MRLKGLVARAFTGTTQGLHHSPWVVLAAALSILATLRRVLAQLAPVLLFVAAAMALALPAQAAPRKFNNQASVRFHEQGIVDVEGAAQSNMIMVELAPRPASIAFYTDDTYSSTADVSGLGRRLFIQANAEACDTSSGTDAPTATLYSEQLQHGLTIALTETAPESNLFRGSADLSTVPGVVTTADDRLWVILNGCPGVDVRAGLHVDPSGMVFDSVTQKPMVGARVTLIDMGNASQPAGIAARPLHAHGDVVDHSVLTDETGRYHFTWLPPPGRYRLLVEPAAGWVFPSQAAAGQFHAQHLIDGNASYGKTFEVGDWGVNALPDVPVDPLSRMLRVQLDASRSNPEIAETLIYTALVRNAGESPLANVLLAGTLPPGLVYVPGSARIDGQPLPDPTAAPGSRGPALRFVLPNMAPGAVYRITYRVVVGAAALNGDGVHRIQARADLPDNTLSNVASHKVDVQPGVFTDKALLLGTVFADCNGNGLQDAGEPGAPGVRLMLPNGSYAVTDALGHYSFYGLRPRTTVLKIDPLTLPVGAVPMPIAQRHAGDGHSRFVDPRRGQLARADFALQGCAPALRDELWQRAARLRVDRELDLSTHTEMTPDGAARAVGDRRALQAAGVVGERADGSAPGKATDKTAAAAHVATPAAAPVAQPADVPAATAADDDGSLEQLALRVDNTLDFIDLKTGQSVSGEPLLLRVKGRAEARMTLQVNGTPIGDDRVGQRAIAPESQVELREYVGVQLRPGRNTLTLAEHDGFGNVRGQRSVDVIAPGALAQLRVTLATTSAPSDGETLVPVQVELLDRDGQRINGRSAITLDSTLGQWDLRDLDPLAPGVQAFIEHGLATFALRAPKTAGDAEITASAGAARAQAKLRFAPALRPLVAVGLVEGVLNLRTLKPSAQAATPQDGFDAALAAATMRSEQDKNGARASVFLKGKVGDETLVTMGYESDKDRRERLFRDIQPDAFYPVYGDDAIKGFDAQSTSRLYALAEQGTASALYGDFSTQTTNPLRQLGAYQRSLTGARLTQAGGPVTGSVWASRDTTRQQVIEQRGNGTSGPFDLGLGTVLANSERIEILTRDRDQPARVLRTTALQRYTDYDFEPLTGRLLLRAPVPSTDSELNPVSIRVTAEVDQGGMPFWVMGADVQLKLNDSVQIGGAIVKDRNPLEPLQLSSANASIKLAERTTLVAEAAHTARPDGLLTPGAGGGDAQRLELVHDGVALRGRAFATRSEANFANPSAGLTAGRVEAGVKGDYRIDERTRVTGEALHSADTVSGRRRDGALLGWERSFEGGAKGEVGLRHVTGRGDKATDPAASETTTSVRAKFSTVIPALPTASAFVEAEQDLHAMDKHMAAVGGDLQLASQGRLYLRHEFISSMTGPYALDVNQRRNSTLLGIDAAAPYDGRAFGEYRLREGLTGREAEAAMGLRNKWTVAEGLRLNTSFERVQALQGSEANQSGAATAALEYTRDPGFKATTRLELRRSNLDRSLLATVAAAWKLGTDWTLLGRAVEASTQMKNGQPERAQQRMQLGLAYRDGASNRVNGLARYEFKREAGLSTLDTSSSTRGVHVVSTHGDWQATAKTTLSGQIAAKWVREREAGSSFNTQASLVGARITHDIAERWDVGAHAHVMSGGGSRSRSVGVEAGYRVQENLWLSAGYNASGFKDRDLGVEQHTERGAYVRMRFKFDERLLK